MCAGCLRSIDAVRIAVTQRQHQCVARLATSPSRLPAIPFRLPETRSTAGVAGLLSSATAWIARRVMTTVGQWAGEYSYRQQDFLHHPSIRQLDHADFREMLSQQDIPASWTIDDKPEDPLVNAEYQLNTGHL